MIGRIDEIYNDLKPDWMRIKDFIKGERQVKNTAVQNEYIVLPAGIEKNTPKARAYVQRGFFPELSSAALNEANGRIFQQEPVIPEADKLEPFGKGFYENTDGAGTSLPEMIVKVVNNLNSTTRCGILVDYAGTGNYMNEAERQASDDRIVWSFYDTLDIVSVRTNQAGKIIKVELAEKIQDDYITLEGEEKIHDVRRVLYIDADIGIYKQRIYEYVSENSKWQQFGEEIIPLMNGRPLDYIPFVIFNGKTNNAEVYKPRLLDMVETVNSIYKNWTDLEHMIYNICTPVRYGTGVSGDDLANIQQAGPTKFWNIANPEAKLGVLDIQGSGLTFAMENIANKLKIAERLGYVFLDSGAKTATQSMIETTGRIITLSDVAKSVAHGIMKCLEISMIWVKGSYNKEEMQVVINIKTDDSVFEANNLSALIQSYMSGILRKRDMHKYMVERKLTDEKDYEKWSQDLDDNLMGLNPDVAE